MRARSVRPDSAEKTVREIRRATRRQYARAFEALLSTESEKQACRAMIGLLALAHELKQALGLSSEFPETP
jgi:hypothetical protein